MCRTCHPLLHLIPRTYKYADHLISKIGLRDISQTARPSALISELGVDGEVGPQAGGEHAVPLPVGPRGGPGGG